MEAAEGFVCVRVTNMSGIDLSVYKFDFDLTFAVLFMNADGTIYHHYGGRDWADSMSRQSMKSLVRVMKETREDHAAYMGAPNPPKAAAKRTIEDIAPYNERLKNRKDSCVHCHMVYEAEREAARASKTWKLEEIWKHPLPDNSGLVLDRDDQTLLVAVPPGMSAGKAGLKKGDRIVSLDGRRIRSQADISWMFHNAPYSGATFTIEYERGGEIKTSKLVLEDGWKVSSPLDYSWRSYKWGLRPNPGFGGPELTDDEKQKAGLKKDSFAMKVNYIIDWGEHPEDGKNAAKAGLKKGDILLSAGGKADFENGAHFQTWYRLTRKPGTTVELVVLRSGKTVRISMDVIP